MAYRSASTPVVLGLGVAVILGSSVATPAAAFADEPSVSPSETTTDPEPQPDPSSSDPEPDPSSPDPDPEPDPSSPDPEPDPSSPDPEPDPSSPDPEPDPSSPDPEPDPSSPAPDPSSPSPSDPSPSDPSPSDPSPSPNEPGERPPSPKPTDPTRPPEPPPGSTVAIKLSLSSPVASPGGSLTATAHVRSGAKGARAVQLMLSGAGFTVDRCTISAPCGLGSVNEAGESVPVTVRVPSTVQIGSYITVYATVTAASSKPQTASVAFGVADGPPAGGTVLPPGTLPGDLTPVSLENLPQAVLPPVASPYIAPGLMLVNPAAAIRPNQAPARPSVQWMAAAQTGWLSGLLAAVSLLGWRNLSAPPGVVAVRGLFLNRDLRRRLNGKRPTPARLRTLPPQPARPPRSQPRIRLIWPPLRPTRPAARRGGTVGA